jgi:lysophospholipase L1-like esterase
MRALLIATLLTLVTASPAVATPVASSGPADDAPVYLALGDSLAFGVGASDPEVTGYVPLVFDALRQLLTCAGGGAPPCSDLQLVNLSESGATTETLLETQLPAALDILQQRNGDADPGNDVRVITVDIGGNDVVHGVFDACSGSLTLACGRAAQETVAIVERNLTAILMPLRGAAGPDTEIAVMTYYNALVGCELSATADNAELILQGVPGVTPGLNGVIREVAARAQVTVVDTFGRLGPDDLVGGEDCLHANDAGYQKIATAFIDRLAADGN